MTPINQKRLAISAGLAVAILLMSSAFSSGPYPEIALPGFYVAATLLRVTYRWQGAEFLSFGVLLLVTVGVWTLLIRAAWHVLSLLQAAFGQNQSHS